jgi:hypothetical protein
MTPKNFLFPFSAALSRLVVQHRTDMNICKDEISPEMRKEIFAHFFCLRKTKIGTESHKKAYLSLYARQNVEELLRKFMTK